MILLLTNNKMQKVKESVLNLICEFDQNGKVNITQSDTAPNKILSGQCWLSHV